MLPFPTRPTTDRSPGLLPVQPAPSGRTRGRLVLASGAMAVLLLIGACGEGSAGAGSTPSSVTGSTGQPTVGGSSTPAAVGTTAESAELTVGDTWVKATEGAQDPSMTAAFGVLINTTDRPVTVVSATTSASDRAELHEMAMVDGAMVMRPKSDGFVVPAGGSTALQPGGEHVMIMDVRDPIRPGDQVTVTLTLDDGSTVDFTALAKDFAGAQEEYAGPSGATSDGAMGMSGGTTTSAGHG